jgi:hypothetical protein
MIAADLGWRLVDKELITEISRRAQVSASEAAAFDERVDPWIHRITRSIWGSGADGISLVAPVDLFDAAKAAYLTKQVIEEAHKEGECVIVGRGSQFILRDRKDVFHAFIYARWEDRVQRIKRRIGPEADAAALIRSMEAERMEYVRLHFRQNRMDPHLYDLMIESKNQPENTARLILSAMRMAPEAVSAT